MVAYKLYTTVYDKAEPTAIDNLNFIEPHLTITPDLLPVDGWDRTTIKLIDPTYGHVFFQYKIKHPADYQITEDNWYIYLKGISNTLNNNNLSLTGDDLHNPGQPIPIRLLVENIIGCTFIECDSDHYTLAILIKPDIRIDTGNEFDIADALIVFDHDYDVSLDDFTYTKGIDKLWVSICPSDTLPAGARYYINNNEPDAPLDLFKDWLFDVIDINFIQAEHRQDELLNPYRLEGKTIGDFKYLESVDKRIKIIAGYKSLTPYDLPVALAEKIGSSSIDAETQAYFYDELGKILKQAIDLYKAEGPTGVVKSFVDFNDRIDFHIARQEEPDSSQ